VELPIYSRRRHWDYEIKRRWEVAARKTSTASQAVGGRLHQWRVGRQRLLVSLFETGEQIERGSYFFIVS
jgi:hypothetical protein